MSSQADTKAVSKHSRMVSSSRLPLLFCGQATVQHSADGKDKKKRGQARRYNNQ